jgi:NADH:ubiquinone oxidoreductase subunit 6 (subunit J)
MERGLVMVFHSAVIALILFFIMFMLLKQPRQIAEDRSVLIGAIALVYMVLFGHGLPNRINRNIM